MSDVEEVSSGSGLSRRVVVRTAAHAAWMVPAVSLVTEAPALAASGDTLNFGAGSGSWSGSLGGVVAITPVLSLSIPITLGTKHGSSATNLTVVVSFAGTGLSVNLTPTAPSGWSVSPTTAGKGPFTFTSVAAVPAPTTLTFNPTFKAPLGIYALAYPMNAKATEGLTASAGSTVTSPPPAGFTDTGQTGGNASVSGSITNSN